MANLNRALAAITGYRVDIGWPTGALGPNVDFSTVVISVEEITEETNAHHPLARVPRDQEDRQSRQF